MKRTAIVVVVLFVCALCSAQVQQTTATLGNPNIFTAANQFTTSVQTPLIINSTDSINLTSTNLALQFNNSVTSTGSIALSSTSLGNAVAISDNNGNSLFLGSSGSRPWNINLTNLALTSGLINTTGTTSYIYGNPLNLGVNSTPSSLGSISNGFTITNTTTSLAGTLTLPGLSGTTCLEQVNGVITDSGVACGGGGGGVTGSGTTNYLPRWTSSSAIGNSVLQYTGSSAFTFDYGSSLISGFIAGTGTGSQNGRGIFLLSGNSGTSGGTPGNLVLQTPSPAFGTTYAFVLLNPTSFSSNSVAVTYDSTNTSTYMTLPDSGGNTSYFRAFSGAPSFACNRPTLVLRTDAPDVSHFLYTCPGGGSTTWTAVTVP